MSERLLLFLTAIGLVILLFFCACQHGAPRIQADLEARAGTTLTHLDASGAMSGSFGLAVDGRDLRLRGAVPDEATRAQAIGALQDLPGVRVVIDELTIAPSTRAGVGSGANADPVSTGIDGTGAAATSDDRAATSGDRAATFGDDAGVDSTDMRLAILAEGGRWVLRGRVADDEARQAWLAAAQATFGADRIVDRLEISGTGDPAGGSMDPAAWLSALALGPTDGGLEVADSVVRVRGSVPDDPAAQRFLDAVADVIPTGWRLEDELTRVGAADAKTVQAALQESLQLRNIAFETNSADLTSAGRQIVRRVAQALRAAPALKVAIEGHTDNSGAEAWNQTLSGQRAETVARELVALGIAPSRLSASGFGSSRPIADNVTPEGRQANRRIEFHVLEGEIQ